MGHEGMLTSYFFPWPYRQHFLRYAENRFELEIDKYFEVYSMQPVLKLLP